MTMRERGLERQNRILQYIKQELERRGYPPSVREICEYVDLKSTSTAHKHLRELEERGLIRRDPSKPRALEVLDNPLSRGRNVPLVGRVTAGEPILAEENIEDHLILPQDYVGHDNLFALRVEGESMINAGILSGDIIIVREQPDASNGEIVVAMIEGEATVKRFYRETKHIRLQPENDAMQPIITKNVSVLGKVVSLIRRY